jgi:protein-arginine kinase activator protein McsA
MKKIKDITEELESEHGKAVNAELDLDVEIFKRAYAKELKKDGSEVAKRGGTTEVKLHMSDEERGNLIYEKIIKIKEKEMSKAVKELDFETAAILRDEISILKTRLDKK